MRSRPLMGPEAAFYVGTRLRKKLVQTPKFIPVATELAVTSFTFTTCLEIKALPEHLLQEGDAKLVMSKHLFSIPFGASSKRCLGRGMYLMYREWLAEINLVFHGKEPSLLRLQRQGARGSSRLTQHSGNLSRQLGPVGWRRPRAGVKVGGPREAVENGHAHVLPPSWRENHTSHVPSATGQRHHTLN